MSEPRGRGGVLPILACALVAGSLALTGVFGQGGQSGQGGQGRPEAPKAAGREADPSSGDRRPIFVTLPKRPAPTAKPGATATPETMVEPMPETMVAAINRDLRAKETPAAVARLTGVVFLVFLIVAMVALRRRAKVCPRCFSLLYELGDRDDAGEDLPADEPRDMRPILACLGCGEVGMLRAGLFFRHGGQCPKCRRWNLAGRFKVVQPSSYMMCGLIRIEEACSCGHEGSFLRSTPPNQAPTPEFVATSPFRA